MPNTPYSCKLVLIRGITSKKSESKITNRLLVSCSVTQRKSGVIRVLTTASVPTLSRFWPSVQIEQLSNKAVKELLHAELASLGKSLSDQQQSAILTHCRTPATCNPLYVVLLASSLARSGLDTYTADSLGQT